MRPWHRSLIICAIAATNMIVGEATADTRHEPGFHPHQEHHGGHRWIAPLILGGLGVYIIQEGYSPPYVPPPIYVPPPVYYPQPRIYYPPRMNYPPAQPVDYFSACAQFADVAWVYTNCVGDMVRAGERAEAARRRR